MDRLWSPPFPPAILDLRENRLVAASACRLNLGLLASLAVRKRNSVVETPRAVGLC